MLNNSLLLDYLILELSSYCDLFHTYLSPAHYIEMNP